MSTATVNRTASEALKSAATKFQASKSAATPRDTRVLRQLRNGASLIGLAATTLFATQPAAAQVAPPPNIVGACSGASLPPSAVTGILTPIINGIVSPIEGTVNPLLGNVKSVATGLNGLSLLGLGTLVVNAPALSIDTTTLLANAAAGKSITLDVLNSNGKIVGALDRCDTQADGFMLRAPAGIAIGGNRITGLGATGLEASAGEQNSVAFGNSATTAGTAANAIAFGTRATVGANATGAIALGTDAVATGVNSVALGAGSVATAGEVSVGAPGAERRIANIAAGVNATDAVNVAQLAGTAQYDGATKARLTLAGAAGTTLANVAPGTLAAGSTEAVNGGQLFATNGAVTNLNTGVVNGSIGTVQYADPATPTVRNGGVPSNDVALVGAAAAPVGLHNVAAGSVAGGSTDAVNGAQLFATNSALGTTTTAVTNLTNNVTNGAVGALRYSNAATPTVPNGGTPSNDAALVGGAAGTVALHNVGAGVIAAGSTDAVNGGQLANLSALAVQYDSPSRVRATLGGTGAAPVALGNVAAGAVVAGSTDAVNGGQLANLSTLAVQYDDTTRVRATLGGTGAAPVALGNVAAGAVIAGSTDAVNGGQLSATNTTVTNLTTSINNGAVGALQYSSAGAPTVPNGGVPSNDAALVGVAAGPVALHNVATGVVATGSTDAVNGGQLFATNTAVGNTNTALGTLRTNVTNGGIGTVQYSSAGAPTVANGGVPSNDLALIGATVGPVALHNVAAGAVAAGSTDAVNGGQLAAVTGQVGGLSALAVQYDDATRARATLGGAGAPPVALGNVAAGTLAAGSTEAVNGGQLFATNTAVGNTNTALTSLTTNITNGGIGALQYSSAANPTVGNGGVPSNDVALIGATVGPVALHNVAAGVVAAGSTDAVNGGQLATVSGQVSGLSTLAVQYDDATRARATLGGAGGAPVALGNVAAGVLGAGSLDAVNGGQLFGLGSNLASAFGGSSTYNPGTGAVNVGILYGGTTYGSVQGAVSAIETSIGGMSPGADMRYFNTTSTMADSRALGSDSTAIGPNAVASADGSIAAGRNTIASGAGSVAIGDGSSATTGKAVAIGFANIASGDGAVAIGDPNIAIGAGAVALGRDNEATGIGAVALGDTNFATGNGSVSIGQTNQATGNGSIAIGTSNVVNGVGALAFGNRNQVNGDGSLAFGSDVVTGGIRTLAVGNASAATGDFAAAFGSNSTAAGLNATALGTDAAASADYTLAVGKLAVASGFGSSALGTLSSATAFASTALGAGAIANLANSVALGSASSTLRGGVANYTAFGLTGTQSSTGEIAVGRTIDYIDPATGKLAPLGTRQITGVGAGSEDTDAVNVAQLRGVSNTLGNALVAGLGGGAAYNAATGAITGPSYVVNGTTYTSVGDAIAGVGGQIGQVAANSVSYDNAAKTSLTLGGTGGTRISNVAAGAVNATSSDAVNGAQLLATNAQVASNTTAITNLGSQITNGATGPVQYSNPGSTTTPNGGTRTNDLTLVGAAAGPVALHNVASGAIQAGSTDAVTGGQVYALAITAVNAVSYDSDANGVRSNRVTLAGGTAGAPVTIANVAAGTVAAGSTEAVNGGQLQATNQAVAAVQTTANSALSLGSNSVQYGPSRTNVTFNAGGGATVLSNVAAGVSATDAANVGQLNSGINSALTQANSYTDGRIAALDFDIRSVRRDSYAGTSGALAAAGLPQAYEAGKGMLAIGGGTYAGQSAVALGLSKAFSDGHTVIKLSGTYDSQGRGGGSGGIGYQF